MSKLNTPREIPYAFRVVEVDEVVWLYDDSTRWHLCEAAKSIWMEPLYHQMLGEGGDECPRCKNGTLEETMDEVRCMGECGAISASCGAVLPDAAYWSASDIEARESKAVPLAEEYVAVDVPEKDAWDAAREEACANCLL